MRSRQPLVIALLVVASVLFIIAVYQSFDGSPADAVGKGYKSTAPSTPSDTCGGGTAIEFDEDYRGHAIADKTCEQAGCPEGGWIHYRNDYGTICGAVKNQGAIDKANAKGQTPPDPKCDDDGEDKGTPCRTPDRQASSSSCPPETPVLKNSKCISCYDFEPKTPYWDGNTCQYCVVAFPDKPYWDTEDSQCTVCPDETPMWRTDKCISCHDFNAKTPYWDGTDCKSCEEGTMFTKPKWDGTSCVACPDATPLWDNNKCITCVSKNADKPYWNEDERQCTACPDETPIWKNGSCVSCASLDPKKPKWDGKKCGACPAKTHWDGETCADGAPAKCCVCYYMDTCSELDEKECNAEDKDCSWSGGNCVSRFEKYCDDWLGKQKSCPGGSWKQEDDGTTPANDTQCSDYNMIRMGHGQGCQHFTDLTKCLLHKCNGTSCSRFQDIGCSVGADAAEVDSRVAELHTTFPNDSFTYSVNQTTAGWPSCQNRVTYSITDQVTKEYTKCDKGGFCYEGSGTISCQDTPKKVVQETCCNCGDGNGIWSTAACPALKHTSGDCTRSDTAVLYLNPCELASRDAMNKSQNCLNAAKDACSKHRGSFSPTFAPGIINNYIGWCTVTNKVTYTCTDMCE